MCDTLRIFIAGLFVLFPLSGVAEGPAFTNITDAAGVGGPTARGETGGHGAMFADVQNDGLPDLYVTMNFRDPMADCFYLNLGGGRFEDRGQDSGLADPDGGSHGACFADLDNDGDHDLFNGTTHDVNWKPATNDLFRNDGGGHFTRVAAPDFVPAVTRAVLTFDMDGDGDLDLFAVSGAKGSGDPAEERNEAYRNDGDFRFSAIEGGDWLTAPCGQGATDTDFDGDGDVDIIAANREGSVNVFRNDGTGRFEHIEAASVGFAEPAKDGITAADVDSDGDLDILLASDDEGHLYLNQGDGRFARTQSFSATDGYMGGFADLDSDGDMDLVFAGERRVWLNDGQGRFTKGPAIPLDGINDPRGIAFADIDRDGDMDFAVVCKRSANQLIRNDLPQGNWLRVRLVSPEGQAGAFGAKVIVRAGGRILGTREARSNNGYLGQDDPVLHFGLGKHERVELTVRFLDGTTVTKKDLQARHEIVVDGRKEGRTP